MKAVRCNQDGVFVAEVDEPRGPGIEVRIRSAGICGSDLHLITANLPHTLGHEFAGLLPDGTPVAVEPLTPCGRCNHCTSGRYNHCTEGGSMILGIGGDGGMAEKVLVPESAIVPLPTGAEITDACLVEPLAVAVHGVRRARIGERDRVAVIGGGTIGLTGVIAARWTGASVEMYARHDAQRAAAERLGASLGDDSEPYDVVIDAAGTSQSLEQAVNLAKPGGRILILSTFWEGMTVPAFGLCMKEIDLIPASLYANQEGQRDFDIAAGLLAENDEIARSIITHRFPLEAASEAFQTAADRKSGAIKVVLEP